MNPTLVGFIIYLAVVLVVGLLTFRLNKTLADFVLAGRKLGPWVVAFSERASGESAVTTRAACLWFPQVVSMPLATVRELRRPAQPLRASTVAARPRCPRSRRAIRA